MNETKTDVETVTVESVSSGEGDDGGYKQGCNDVCMMPEEPSSPARAIESTPRFQRVVDAQKEAGAT